MSYIKKTLIVLLLAFSASTLALPVSAQETPQDCSRIAAAQTRYDVEAERFIQRTHDIHHMRNVQFLKQRDLRETQLFNQIDRSQAQIDREFEILRSRVRNEDQSTAVENYIGNVNEASATRRDRVIEAVVNYRNATDSLIIERWSRLEASYFEYRDNAAASGAKALSDCESGVPSREVSQTLVSDIRAIKETNRSNILQLREFDVTLRDLRRERETAVIEANREFLLTKRDLRSQLQSALQAAR